MYQLINKDDFAGIVKWSANIPDRDVDFYCIEAQKFDVYPVMPLAVVTGNNFIEDIEIAIQESPVTKTKLVAFYDDYVKPFLVCKAYERLLVLHGRNITQFGLRVNNEETSSEVSDKARGEWIEQTTHKANVYLADLMKEMKKVNYTFDSVVYSFAKCDNKPKYSTRIKAI